MNIRLKNIVKILILVFVISFASCKKPIDYSNKAVYAGNVNPLQQMDSKLDRLEEEYGDAPMDMKKMVKLQTVWQETRLIELKEFIGNSESDPMMTSAYVLLENNLNVAKAEKNLEFFEIMDNAKTIEKAKEEMTPQMDYYHDI